ncbi:NAD(P)H-hydrate dehydratase [Clostridium bovifaecis]|uniref:Bifunctional NAD(P)H-hydrate repair enzyme n=1 Tax=Clostridium bovifaecis TaxID=2184719 RepID=A0A6I6EVD0_9CLOT|nr:NAD(P)H-hydrate dehydratase [Clostridium bovifaecis]
MKIVTAQKMREVDKFCIENLGIPSMVLMENAALKALNNLDTEKYNSFTIVCGTGNNGGDGLALARHLFILGKKLSIFIIGEEDSLSKDCRANYNILLNMNLPVSFIKNSHDIEKLQEAIKEGEVTVDAIFGTGISRDIKGIYEEAIRAINDISSYTISIDVPSGLNSDSGEILGCCVTANKTISFQFYKKGFLKYGADTYTGEIVIENIGIPNFLEDEFSINDFILDINRVRKLIPMREKYLHKGDLGRVSIVAGSIGFTGAAFISTQSAVRCGAGLVTLCCPENIQDILSIKLVEAMTVSFKNKDKLNEILGKSDVIAVGPGMGNNEGTSKIVADIIRHTNCPVVIDADGINVLKNNLDILKLKNNKIVLTPHLGEMSRVTGISIDKIEKNRIEIAKLFSREYDVILLLKGYNTVITDGKTVVVNTTGNSAMASGGMGDSLTGIIASFIAQGFEPFKAAYLGAYVHGYCGDRLSESKFSVNAADIIEKIPFAIKELQS